MPKAGLNYADRGIFCGDRNSFMPIAAAFTTIEAVYLPVEAMDHLEHSKYSVVVDEAGSKLSFRDDISLVSLGDSPEFTPDAKMHVIASGFFTHCHDKLFLSNTTKVLLAGYDIGLVCWSLTSLCHINGHIETMPSLEESNDSTENSL